MALVRVSVLALAVALVAGCSGGGSKPTPARTADSVVAQLKAAGLPVTGVVEVSAASDSNHLLGRPNGYTSKVTFSDSRIKAASVADLSAGSVDLGGAVEAYPTAGGATARAAYIQGILKASPALGTEYDYTAGGVLLRLSSALTPTEAAAYKAAL